MRQSIPSDTAFTGALNIHTRETGDVVGVSNVSEKLHTALRSGLTRLYLPLQNQSDLSLSATKAAEGKVEIKPVRQLNSVARELFYRKKDPSWMAIAHDVLNNFFAFFLPGRRRFSSISSTGPWDGSSNTDGFTIYSRPWSMRALAGSRAPEIRAKT